MNNQRIVIEDLYTCLKEINKLIKENEQLKKDCTALIYHNQEYRKENNKIKTLLFQKIKELNDAYEKSAKAGVPTGGIIGELDLLEEICEEMEWLKIIGDIYDMAKT